MYKFSYHAMPGLGGVMGVYPLEAEAIPIGDHERLLWHVP